MVRKYYTPVNETPTLIGILMTNDTNSADVFSTEEEMYQSGGAATILAGLAFGAAVFFVTMKTFKRNDRLKAKKNAQNEN